MIDFSKNPIILNNFLVYNESILNKSKNTVKEYNYDLNRFFKFIKVHKKLTDEKDFSKIEITDINLDNLKTIDINDLYAYLAYLTELRKSTSIQSS